jgi:hypothetical protein
MIFSPNINYPMSYVPSFDGTRPPQTDFRTVFASDPATYSNVMNQYAIPPEAPISRMAADATKLVKYAESYPQPETYSLIYDGPYPNLSFAYGK